MFLNVQICRLCLKKKKDNGAESTPMVLINGARELLDMIYKATTLKVAESRRQPKQFLCNVCERTVRDFADFRKKCIVSDSIFRRIFFQAAYTDDDSHGDEYMPRYSRSTKDKQPWADERKSKRRREEESTDNMKKTPRKSEADDGSMIDLLEIYGDFSFETETDITISIEQGEPAEKTTEAKQPTVAASSKPSAVAVADPEKATRPPRTSISHTSNSANSKTNESNDKGKDNNDKGKDSNDTTVKDNDDKANGSEDQHSESIEMSNTGNNGTIATRDDAELECTDCGMMLSSNRALLRHRLKHSASELAHTCDICLKSFRLQQSLQIHLLTHRGVRRYKCEVCSKRFATQGTLLTHNQIHSGLKTFKCDKCEKMFRLKSQLKVHLLTHIGERTYECSQCEKAFTTKGNLILHAQVHNGKQQSRVSATNSKGTAAEADLQSSTIGTESEGKANQCDICGKEFALKIALKTHIKTHASE